MAGLNLWYPNKAFKIHYIWRGLVTVMMHAIESIVHAGWPLHLLFGGIGAISAGPAGTAIR